MEIVARACDQINKVLGILCAGAGLALILVQFGLVLVAHVFDLGSIAVQDSRYYLNGFLFLGAGGYTLVHNGHVRVDLFYRDAPPQVRAFIDLLGLLALLFPILVLLWSTGLPYVTESWAQQEGAIEAGALPYVYLLKSTLLLFTASLTLAALSLGLRAWAGLFAHP